MIRRCIAGSFGQMMKTILKRTIALVVLIMIAASAMMILPAIRDARRSCNTMESFARSVAARDWTAANGMLNADANWMCIQDGKVLYWGKYDVTRHMASAKPRFWKTFEYYLTDRSMGDKVIFQGSSVADYARLNDGKITQVKLP